MIPAKKEWRNWSSLERVTYVAQFLVPVSLLFTVGFSFLSWREARIAQELTRESQQQERSFFIAENPPKLDLDVGQVLDSHAGPILFLWIKNFGDSAAKSPCAEIGRLEGGYMETFTTNCSPPDPYSRVTLRKGETVTYHVPQKGFLKFRPRKVKILRPNEPTPPDTECGGQVDMLMVTVRYKDVLDAPHATLRQVQLCE